MGSNEVARGSSDGGREMRWQRGRGGERPKKILQAVPAEYMYALDRRRSKNHPPLFGLGDRLGAG